MSGPGEGLSEERPWHCAQIPSTAGPLVVCQREELAAEVDRLRAENERAGDFRRALHRWAEACDLDDPNNHELLNIEAGGALAALDGLTEQPKRPVPGETMTPEALRAWIASTDPENQR